MTHSSDESSKTSDRDMSSETEMEPWLEALDLQGGWSGDGFVVTSLSDPEWIRDGLVSLGLERTRLTSSLSDGVVIEELRDDELEMLQHGVATLLAPEAILLDLDGVLADVTESYRRSFIETAATFGVEFSLEEISQIKAAGDANNDWVLLQRCLEERGVDAEYEEVKARYQSFYRGDGDQTGLWRHETVIPDEPLLQRLADRLALGIVTGRTRESADRFFEHTGLDRYIEACVCLEDAPRKPNPDPVELLASQMGVERGWLVGDTPDDVLAARRASALPLGIVSPSDEEDAMEPALREAGCAGILNDLEELGDRVDELDT